MHGFEKFLYMNKGRIPIQGRRLLTLALAFAFLLTSALIWIPGQARTVHAASLSLCGNSGTAPAIKHVIVVMMENRSYNQVVGSTDAPYQTSLANTCGVGTADFAATHTSAANYLATSAGEYPSTSPPGCGSVKNCADTSNNIYHQLDTAGLTWKSYEESMPSACDTSSSFPYKIGHNPALFYTDLTSAECQANDIPVSDLTAQSGPFWNALQNQTLPSVSWVTPNQNDDNEANDAGTGITGAQAEQLGDTWVKNFLTNVQQSNSYQAGNTAVLIAYDEGNGSDYTVGENCTNESLDMPVTNGVSAHQDSCHVPLFVVYPYTPAGNHDGTFFDHYSITKTIEQLFGLSYLSHAGDTQTNSLLGHFGLSMSQPTSAPTVSITAPSNGATVSGTLTVSGTASSSVGLSDVTVSVDNGTPQTATGTTSWSSTIGTTTLSNGTHTITATAHDTAGNTATSSITVDVNNVTTSTACAATPSGMVQLSGNLSVESNLDGWTGIYNTNTVTTRVEPVGGSYDGLWALQVNPKASGAAGINNAKPIWETSSVAGNAYTGSAEVRASTAGETISLLMRETTQSGKGVGYHTTTMTLNDTNWHQISSAYTAKNSGDNIRYMLYVSNFANSAQYFQADCLSLLTN